MASPIVSVPEPVSSLNVEIGVNPALYALYQTSHLIAPTRPGRHAEIGILGMNFGS